ncbi:MAG: c-type cytochrome [Bacteroidia bacterium]|nr:c-type cytochrome [Bacteroidia bacterium]
MTTVYKYFLLISSGLILFSCKVDPKIEPILPSDNLKEIIPPGWPDPVYRFNNNPIKEEVFILGRALFYDPILSRDNTVSCGSCHQQFAAFAQADHVFSHGVDDKLGTRNSPVIFNMNWHSSFFHDGGVNHIELQPIAPIQNPVEMDLDFNAALDKLKNSARYKKLFTAAYGDETVTSSRMLKAMAQFMGLLYSYNSRYDMYKRGENGVIFTEQEQRGYQLFLANCNSCHKEPLFSDFSFRNNGLAVNTLINDSGRARITQLPEDRFKFKVPTLRNVALSAPYMHDGRYTSLQQCLDHYTNNVVNMTNLDPLLLPNGIPMNNQQKADIIEFLKTLNDYKFINDKRFANPGLN